VIVIEVDVGSGVMLGGVRVDANYKQSLVLLQQQLGRIGRRLSSFADIRRGDLVLVIPPRCTNSSNKFVPLPAYLVQDAGNKFNDDGTLGRATSEPDTPGLFISTSENGPYGFILEVGPEFKKKILPDFSLIEIQPEELQDGLVYKINT